MANTPLPSLFGRFTVVLQDHRDLGVTLRSLEKLCATLDETERAPPLEPAALELIVELHAELSQHFTAEEGDAYFGAMARDRPGSAHRIAELKQQHAEMLAAVGSLRDLAGQARWTELSSPARRFVAGLRAHEAAETRLLQEFFLRDEGVTED
jgi:hypothetical protein